MVNTFGDTTTCPSGCYKLSGTFNIPCSGDRKVNIPKEKKMHITL